MKQTTIDLKDEKLHSDVTLLESDDNGNSKSFDL